MQHPQDDSSAFDPLDSVPTDDDAHTLADLHLGGVDRQIAARLARIAEQARNDQAGGHNKQLSSLRAELDLVVEHMDPRSSDLPRETPALRKPARAGRPFDQLRELSLPRYSRLLEDGRSSSPLALLALGAAAIASVLLAVFVSPGGNAGTPRTFVVAGKPPAMPTASTAAAIVPAKFDSSEETRAKRARDSARGARFRSAKAEAFTYYRELHLTAQRKELEADAAFYKGTYGVAISAYDMARDGYQRATERAEFLSGSMEKAKVDAQVAMDAPPQPTAQFVGYYASPTRAENSPGGVLPPLILTPPAPARDVGPYAAVFTEPTDGSQNGGTWGACWRSTLDSARDCARNNCEGGRKSLRPCTEVASSQQGEHCVVARAGGYGIASGFCAATRRAAEAAALSRCRDQLVVQYGARTAGCDVAWSSAG